MQFDRTAYGKRIKRLRISTGLTQEQLAEKMNVTSTYIVKIENSQRTGSIEFSVELAYCFARTSPSELRMKQSCLSLATSIPTQIMMIPPAYLFDAGSTGHFTLVTLFHINRLAVSN